MLLGIQICQREAWNEKNEVLHLIRKENTFTENKWYPVQAKKNSLQPSPPIKQLKEEKTAHITSIKYHLLVYLHH